ncbi:hypothetical protein DFP72DRAFT_471255 [Ephemerocybe angulata]|uniref:NACHT domain-containing protein n=1 Tax=Ephemerocybe angulata TaxID=980116 RepID=A0A8H6HR21_9AGAR|nr:hypothetical protein DFP72DRAFT_471255 [Tulosesus angulatus]
MWGMSAMQTLVPTMRAPGVQLENGSGSIEDGMKYLVANIAPGAIHDSQERSDAPKCMEETRVAVQQEIMSWIEDGERDTQPKRIMWVTGPAGTGKTAILGTIADACKDKGTLAASFFFSAFAGSANRRTKRCFVPTLAFQLMGHRDLKGIRQHVLLPIAEDKGIIFTKNLKEQFITMVLNPVLSMAKELGGSTQARLVIIIDGLDECDAEQYQGKDSSAHVPIRRKEDDQREILSLLLLAANNPSFPFRILVGSRPEHPIHDFFATEGKVCTRELFLDNKYDPASDIALFYKAKFSIICRRFRLPEDWPGEEAIFTLIENASGQFIYAATVVRYIEGSPDSTNSGTGTSGQPSTPHRRLEHILRLNLAHDSNNVHNPLAALDALYRLLLESSPDPELSMKWLRAAEQHVGYGQRPTVRVLRLVLETSPDEEQYALGSLSSLLLTQPPEKSLDSPYPFYHKSFLDFIVDETRCGLERYLTIDQVRGWMTQRFFRTLNQPLEVDVLVEYAELIHILSWSTPATVRNAESEILSSDLEKWVTATVEEDVRTTHTKRAIEDVLEIVHGGCSWYHCRTVCKISTKRIISVLESKGWKIPSKSQIFKRERKGEDRYQDLETPLGWASYGLIGRSVPRTLE